MNIIENRIWKSFAIGLAFLATTTPFSVSYITDRTDGSIPKQVSLEHLDPIAPMSILTDLGNQVDINLIVNDKSYKNIIIQEFILKNIGSSPIVPGDFVKPLSVRVDPPWEIIAIDQGSNYKIIPWVTKSKQWVSADPFLMNPDDLFVQTVYLASAESVDDLSIREIEKSSSVSVKARIIGLKGFTIIDNQIRFNPFEEKHSLVYLSWSDILFLIVLGSIILFWYLFAIEKCELANFPSKKAFSYVILFSALSYGFAEVITYMIFGGNPMFEYFMGGKMLLDWRVQWVNWLVLAINFCVVIFLYWRSKKI